MSAWSLSEFNTALGAAGLPLLTQAQYDANPNISLNPDNSPSSPAQYVQMTLDNKNPEVQAQRQVANNAIQAKRYGGNFLTDFGGSIANPGILLAPLALAAGPELGALTGLGETGTSSAIGAVGGAINAEFNGQNPLTGALEGGALGGLTSGISNNFGDITSGLGVTGADTAGQSFGQVSGLNDFISSNTGLSAGGAPSGGTTIGGPGPGAAALSAPGGSGLFDNAGDVTSQFSEGLSGGDNLTSLDSGGLNSFTAANSPNFLADGVDPASVSPSASTGGVGGSSGAVNLTGANGVVNPDQIASGASGGGNVGTGSFDINGGVSSGATKLSDMGSNVIGGGSTGSTIEDLGNTLTGGSNTPSPGTISANNNTFGSLNNMNFPSLDGGADMNLGQIANAPVSAGAGASGGAGIKAPSSISSFFDDPSLGGFGSMLAANAGPLVAGGGLLANLVQGNKPVPGEPQVNAAAEAATAQGQQLQSYLPNGTLPPGVQQGINQQSASKKAAIRSRYAQMGGSGSSAEQQDLAAVDQEAQAQGSQIALQLLQAGMSESNQGAALYQNIARDALQQDNELGSAISAFASSFGGGNNYQRPAPGQ